MDGDAARAAAPRAPGSTSVVVGSGAQSAEAAAIRSAVRMAVPDGASILLSWWSSMISAVSNHGAAISAKRIMRTAPMAKFGAMRQLLRVKAAAKRSRSASVKPVVPTTAWMPCSAAKARFSRAASSWVKSTTTSTPAATSASEEPVTGSSDSSPTAWRRSIPAWNGSTAATSSSSGSPRTAPHTVAPMRPAAPNTPTFVIGREP